MTIDEFENWITKFPHENWSSTFSGDVYELFEYLKTVDLSYFRSLIDKKISEVADKSDQAFLLLKYGDLI